MEKGAWENISMKVFTEALGFGYVFQSTEKSEPLCFSQLERFS